MKYEKCNIKLFVINNSKIWKYTEELAKCFSQLRVTKRK